MIVLIPSPSVRSGWRMAPTTSMQKARLQVLFEEESGDREVVGALD